MLPDDISQTKPIIHETFSDFSKPTCVILILVPKSLENVAKQCNFFCRMFKQASTQSAKNAGRYYEQFVKVAHPKTSSKQVKELPASLYTSPKSKYNSYNNGNNSKKN